MKDKKRTIPLAAKAIGGIAFLFVFVLNIMLFVQKDNASSSLSLESLKAYAQTGGEDGEDGRKVEGGPQYLYQEVIGGDCFYEGVDHVDYAGYWGSDPSGNFFGYPECPEGSTYIGGGMCEEDVPHMYPGTETACYTGGYEPCYADCN